MSIRTKLIMCGGTSVFFIVLLLIISYGHNDIGKFVVAGAGILVISAFPYGPSEASLPLLPS